MAVSKTISKNREMGRFNQSLLVESFLGDLGNVTNLFHLILKVHADFSFTSKIYCLIRIQDMLSAVINTIKTKNNCFKALGMNSAIHCS